MTSCSNKSRWQITPCIQVGRLVAATCCGDYGRDILLHVYWRIFGKSLSLQHNLFPHQVTQILCDLNFFDMLQGPKFFCGDKDFHKNSPVHLKWFVAATCHLVSVLIFRVNCAFCTCFPWAIGCAKVGKIPSCQLYLITITDILTAWFCQDSKWIVHCKLVVSRIILVIVWLGNVELGVIGPLQVCWAMAGLSLSFQVAG